MLLLFRMFVTLLPRQRIREISRRNFHREKPTHLRPQPAARPEPGDPAGGVTVPQPFFPAKKKKVFFPRFTSLLLRPQLCISLKWKIKDLKREEGRIIISARNLVNIGGEGNAWRKKINFKFKGLPFESIHQELSLIPNMHKMALFSLPLPRLIKPKLDQDVREINLPCKPTHPTCLYRHLSSLPLSLP